MDPNQKGEKLSCPFCARGCRLGPGEKGACGSYLNEGGKIKEVFSNRYLVTCPISIETMPVLHFYPGGKFLQVSGAGCNFHCPGCISAAIAREVEPGAKILREIPPQEIVEQAVRENCLGIAWLLNDPLSSWETFLGVAREAKKRGLLVGCSTNAYFSTNALAQACAVLDFINVGAKGISRKAYFSSGGSSFEPVWDSIRKLYRQGVHVEVSIPHHRHNAPEIMELARLLASLSPNLPLQVMRFVPLEETDLHWEPSIYETEALCLELKNFLPYVYAFNCPGTVWLDTRCSRCGESLIRRDFYGPMGAKIISRALTGQNRCPACGEPLFLRGEMARELYWEGDFAGGYPFTRALEMIEAILIALRIKDKSLVVKVWGEVLAQKELRTLHRIFNDPAAYVGLVKELGQLSGARERAEELAGYLTDRLDYLRHQSARIKKRPRVYYAMGHPLFALKGERLENKLVKLAGGQSVNEELFLEGRPGQRISKDTLNRLNPEVIFISSFISAPLEEFLAECSRLDLRIAAVEDKRIHNHPAPGWDFGSPRWVLGLMYMANLLQPELYNFDISGEARGFYRRFYGLDFSLANFNRSFSKPDSRWRWRKQIN